MDACMKINSPAHDLHIFIRFSPSLNSLTLKVVGQWSHFSPILLAKLPFVINTVGKKKGSTPYLCGGHVISNGSTRVVGRGSNLVFGLASLGR
ncbi:MAG: hypothetical protein [Circular genetic element sp.]|nr:MAG: hypothetical protein [Circular genetic element sp.]